ncbi:MAG: DUF4923 family protein [Prevotella sp.]|nr:DUF4923 family protein [Prevotella sp.]
MKKQFFRTTIMALMLMCSVCANAQIDLGNILGGLTGGGNSSSGEDLVSNLTSVFSGKKQAASDKLVGTWVYSEPAIVFQSDNLLAKAGSKIAAGKIEDKLQTQLSKYGIKPGAFTITFKSDGTFTETFGKKTMNGKWEVKDSKLYMTFSGRKAIPITTQLESKKLMIVTDATKLLTLVKSVASSSNNSNMQIVSSLMKSINGMQAGLTLVKK